MGNPLAQSVRQLVQRVLTREQRAALKRGRDLLARRFGGVGGAILASDLPALAMLYGSDKWGGHWYAQHYETHFKPWRTKELRLLEIGIGGYADPRAGGASLRMWKAFFPRAQIYGIDIQDKRPHDEERIRTFIGDQTDERFLRDVIDEIGRPDIIIDDGSHMNDHVIKSFGVLFPLLADEGIYAVEDTQTSYWPNYGGSGDLSTSSTSMGFLKSLTDALNWQERIQPGYQPSYFDEHIAAMHFYHNLVIVQKGLNREGSMTLENNALPTR